MGLCAEIRQLLFHSNSSFREVCAPPISFTNWLYEKEDNSMLTSLFPALTKSIGVSSYLSYLGTVWLVNCLKEDD